MKPTTPGQASVLLKMSSLACAVSRAFLADGIKLSYYHTYRVMDQLEARNLVKIVQRPKRRVTGQPSIWYELTSTGHELAVQLDNEARANEGLPAAPPPDAVATLRQMSDLMVNREL